jgi:hypothetical protein
VSDDKALPIALALTRGTETPSADQRAGIQNDDAG